MPAIDASLVFLPRFTTLAGATEFTTAPLDVSGQAGTQFQVWRGPIRVSSGGAGTFTLYIEESLDAQSWALGPSTPQGFLIAENATVFFAYSFRLRWFRLRVALGGTNPIGTCWAEGILRAGDGGMWGMPSLNPASATGPAMAGAFAGPGPGRTEEDPWLHWNDLVTSFSQPGMDPYAQQRQLADLYAAIGKKPGAGKNPPPFPQWNNLVKIGAPVTPPQIQKGP
jgi:hypothetical protein